MRGYAPLTFSGVTALYIDFSRFVPANSFYSFMQLCWYFVNSETRIVRLGCGAARIVSRLRSDDDF